MNYVFNGRLFASICDGQRDSVPNTVVRLYRLEDTTNAATAYTAAQSKEVSQVFDEKQVKSRKKLLLAETTTDRKGNFSFEIDGEKNDYQGGAVAVVLYYNEMPDYGQHGDALPKNFTMFEVLLDVVQPKWRETNNGLAASWNHTILQRIWCYILKRLDLWVICGTVLNCKSEEPIQGIEVTAMDDDIITDDTLGTAITNSEGRFCIVYRSIDFKKTFLSPFINLETTPPFSFDSGPDVYFKYSVGGQEFYAESPSEAQKTGRKNVGNCLCVRLCLDDTPSIPGGTDDPIAGFYQIGNARKYHPVLNIDPSTGRTTGKVEANFNEQAFYSTLDLRGALTKKLNGQPMEYKFEYVKVASPSVDLSTIPEAAWKPITEDEMAENEIGTKVTQIFPVWKYTSYRIKRNDSVTSFGTIKKVTMTADHWIQVPQDAQLHLNGSLIKLVTSKLSGGTVDMNWLTPGQSAVQPGQSPPDSLQENEYFALRMWKREQGSTTEVAAGYSRPLAMFNITYLNVKKGGSWSPTTNSSQLGVATVDLKELTGPGNGCNKISNSLHVNYTAANPNLGNVSIHFKGKGATQNFEPINYATPGAEAYGSSGYTGPFEKLEPCAYEVRLSVELKLTNGEHQHDNIEDRVLFCR
ncbi:hypothetical protein [Altibacter sp. HG106]|uniref:hypothetical protein n=1 Tax=Altibacter sp. HG106 TaxID=3023937 RepID=UPI002350B0BF|nr:hypothetical protein [Altibacter sp. HG106]MDC7994926.1 hypothetical protein [Altibacter sp. HG106]